MTVGAIGGLALSTPLIGALGARRAATLLFAVIAAGLCLIGLGPAVAHSVVLTVVGFAAIGLGIGAVDVLLNVEGAAVEQRAARTLMPLMHGAWSAGAIVGAGIGAVCSALRLDIAVQFISEAGLVVVAGTIASHALRTAAADAAVDRAPRRHRIQEWLSGWKDLRLLLIGVVMLGVELGEGTANNWLTLAVHDGHAQPDAIAASFLVVFAAAEMSARIAAGPIVDRIGRVAAVRATAAVGAVGVVLVIVAEPWPLVLLGTILWGIGVSMGFPLGMSAAATGANPAARVSVVASIGYLANLGGPPLIGGLSQSLGLLHALWAVVALLVVGLLLAGSLRRRRVLALDG